MADPASIAPASSASEEKLSPAELKKRAKAEKQARRAAQKGDQAGDKPAEQHASSSQATSQLKQAKPKIQQSTAESKKSHPTRAQTAEGTALPVRRRPSQNLQQSEKPTGRAGKGEDKHIDLFSHLYSVPRRRLNDPIPRDVHPMVVSVGLQMNDFSLCGSSARCVAMMTAFRHAIQAYSTPKGTSLARHLTAHYLSPQIDFLRSCRPLSESMGNAIRFLKKRIIEIDPSVDDETAKAALCKDIDTFVRERIHVTGHAIAETASKQIKQDSVLLVYAKSSLVEKSILHAHSNGTRFRVIVVDSRPLFEGKSMARSLMRAGVQVEYVPLSGITQAIKDATTVLLGAHSMLSNGRLQSRVGTALVSMLSYKAGIPVIVCCESLKFSGKVALDSIVQNEVTSPDEVLRSSTSEIKSLQHGDADHAEPSPASKLEQWRDINRLQPLNLMYDVTPAEYIRMVICEYGSLPSSSVPVVHRLANEGI